MKKRKQALKLSRETLGSLQAGTLNQALGGCNTRELLTGCAAVCETECCGNTNDCGGTGGGGGTGGTQTQAIFSCLYSC